MGYEIVKVEGAKAEYTRNYPYAYSTYCPWFEGWFRRIYAKIQDYTLVSEDRCYIIRQFCLHAFNLEGDFVECGVYQGGTAYLIADTIRCAGDGKRLHLFDSFEGMPAIASKERDGHGPGEFGDVSLAWVRKYLREFSFIEFYQGMIPQTFDKVRQNLFSFVHVDVDLYSTTLACLEFFYDKVVPGGIIICDDYGFPGYRNAAKAAVDKFFIGKPEKLTEFHSGQCLVIKL